MVGKKEDHQYKKKENMTIVGIRSTWSTGAEQFLDNLLHINRLLEDGEIYQQPTVLRPDNASCSEYCRITLNACNNMVFTGLQIVCSARHMEVYEGQESYLETVKGQLKDSNGHSLYWHTYACGRPLETLSVKFVSLKDKEKLDLFGIWLTLDEGHHQPDKNNLVNMEEVDRMLINDQGHTMLRQLMSSFQANTSSTPQSQTNSLLPMMLQLFTQSTMSQRTDTRQTNTLQSNAKQLLCEEGNKDKCANNDSETSTSNFESNTKHAVVETDAELHKEKFSSDALSNVEKEQSNNQDRSSCVTCSCGANVEVRLTRKMEEMELQLQAKLQEMDDYRYHMDKKFQLLENKYLDLLKENSSSHSQNT